MNDQEQLETLEKIFKHTTSKSEELSDLFVVIESETDDVKHFNETSRIHQWLNDSGFKCQEFGSRYDADLRKFCCYLFCKRTSNADQVTSIKSTEQHKITILPDIAWATSGLAFISIEAHQKSRGGQAAGIRHQEVLITHNKTGISAVCAYHYLKEKHFKSLAHDFLMATMFGRLKQLRKQWA